MTMRNFTLLSSLIFAAFAVVHLLRIFGQWDVAINGWHAPMWVSYVSVLIGALLSLAGFRLLRQMRYF